MSDRHLEYKWKVVGESVCSNNVSCYKNVLDEHTLMGCSVVLVKLQKEENEVFAIHEVKFTWGNAVAHGI